MNPSDLIGSIVFLRTADPREGTNCNLSILETTILSLINFPSLIATNAAQHKLAAKELG